MLITFSISDISNGYLVEYSDPNCVLFKEGYSKVYFSTWRDLVIHVGCILENFKKKAK